MPGRHRARAELADALQARVPAMARATAEEIAADVQAAGWVHPDDHRHGMYVAWEKSRIVTREYVQSMVIYSRGLMLSFPRETPNPYLRGPDHT